MRVSPRRFRDVLLVMLAVVTGVTDATAFERLGHVFASVITGNLVLLGISAVRADGNLALFSGCALCGYALGVIVAAPRRHDDGDEDPVWPAGATLALAADLVLLIAFAVVWEVDGHNPGRGGQIAMLSLLAAAMGAQSTAVRRLGQISTTYLTSTLTGLLESIVARRWSASHTRSLGILGAALAGAGAAIALVTHARAWLPALQLLPLVVVELASLRLIRAVE